MIGESWSFRSSGPPATSLSATVGTAAPDLASDALVFLDFFDFFGNFFRSREVHGTDDFDLGFGFTEFKSRAHRQAGIRRPKPKSDAPHSLVRCQLLGLLRMRLPRAFARCLPSRCIRTNSRSNSARPPRTVTNSRPLSRHPGKHPPAN